MIPLLFQMPQWTFLQTKYIFLNDVLKTATMSILIVSTLHEAAHPESEFSVAALFSCISPMTENSGSGAVGE